MIRETRVAEMQKAGWDFLFPEEVAKIARIDIITVYRHIQEGHIMATKIVGTWRIKRADAERYLSGLEPAIPRE